MRIGVSVCLTLSDVDVVCRRVRPRAWHRRSMSVSESCEGAEVALAQAWVVREAVSCFTVGLVVLWHLYAVDLLGEAKVCAFLRTVSDVGVVSSCEAARPGTGESMSIIVCGWLGKHWCVVYPT